jgi:hypothetical protein
MSQKTKKWLEVYPAGTQAGDEEKKFFVAIARNPKYTWRSVSALASETGLTKTRCEEIIAKYHPKGIILQNQNNPDQWGYWETVGADPSVKSPGLADADKDARVKKAVKK